MKNITFAAVFASLLLAGTSRCRAQESPEMPKPQKEHEWLQKFVGEWDSASEASMGPDQPTMTCKGTQRARMLGGFWMIAEGEAEMMGTPVQMVLTLGYDPTKGKYIGTWTDSMNHHMWHYLGTVDEAGKTLTLETEGPNFFVPGTTSKYREVIEFKSKDHYVFSSAVQGEDDKWTTFMTANYRRKK